VDYPSAFYWKQLMRMYPNAKIIMTTRNSSAWRKSVHESIYQIIYSFDKFPIKFIKNLIGKGPKIGVAQGVCRHVVPGLNYSVISAVDAGDEESVKFFEAWQDDVRAHVPKDKLLIFQVIMT